MKSTKVILVLGVLGLVYGVGYVRGHVGARISSWCDRRAASKLNTTR